MKSKKEALIRERSGCGLRGQCEAEDGDGKGDDFGVDDLLGEDLEVTHGPKRKKIRGGRGGGARWVFLPAGSTKEVEASVAKSFQLNETEYLEFLKLKAKEVLDVSANLLLEEAANKVLEEDGG